MDYSDPERCGCCNVMYFLLLYFVHLRLFQFFYVLLRVFVFFFFKQKTAYEMRISDWSSDVCSSDLRQAVVGGVLVGARGDVAVGVIARVQERDRQVVVVRVGLGDVDLATVGPLGDVDLAGVGPEPERLVQTLLGGRGVAHPGLEAAISLGPFVEGGHLAGGQDLEGSGERGALEQRGIAGDQVQRSVLDADIVGLVASGRTGRRSEEQ